MGLGRGGGDRRGVFTVESQLLLMGVHRWTRDWPKKDVGGGRTGAWLAIWGRWLFALSLSVMILFFYLHYFSSPDYIFPDPYHVK